MVFLAALLTQIWTIRAVANSGPSDSANSDPDFSFTLISICKDQKNTFQNLAIFIKNGNVFVSWPWYIKLTSKRKDLPPDVINSVQVLNQQIEFTILQKLIFSTVNCHIHPRNKTEKAFSPICRAWGWKILLVLVNLTSTWRLLDFLTTSWTLPDHFF